MFIMGSYYKNKKIKRLEEQQPPLALYINKERFKLENLMKYKKR